MRIDSGHIVSDKEFLTCHSEEQRDEESLRIVSARPDSRDFSLTSFARNDMSITYLFTTIEEHRPAVSNQLFVYALLSGRVDHGFDVFRLGLVKERAVAHDQTTTFTGRINELLNVIFHLLRRA